jgi:predicted acetyltransferase
MGNKSITDKYELLRFCNKLDTNVIGGASKLLNYFIKNYNPKEIISYADRRWSNGNLYEKLGFEFVHNSKPNYWYINDNVREYRFKYRKSELVKDGFDSKKTEKEIMFDRGVLRIYDCGNKKYKLIIDL